MAPRAWCALLPPAPGGGRCSSCEPPPWRLVWASPLLCRGASNDVNVAPARAVAAATAAATADATSVLVPAGKATAAASLPRTAAFWSPREPGPPVAPPWLSRACPGSAWRTCPLPPCPEALLLSWSRCVNAACSSSWATSSCEVACGDAEDEGPPPGRGEPEGTKRRALALPGSLATNPVPSRSARRGRSGTLSCGDAGDGGGSLVSTALPCVLTLAAGACACCCCCCPCCCAARRRDTTSCARRSCSRVSTRSRWADSAAKRKAAFSCARSASTCCCASASRSRSATV
jgi:hypothetical protein